MRQQDSYDSDGNDNNNNSDQEGEMCFCVERPVEELPTFQSHIYTMYSPITVDTKVITDDISHRTYYGMCPHCSDPHFLGTLVTKCDEPLKLYARVK